MKNKIEEKIDLIWAVSLMILGVAAVILAFGNIVGLALSDTAVRVIGIIDLLTFPVFLYAVTVRGRKKREERHEL